MDPNTINLQAESWDEPLLEDNENALAHNFALDILEKSSRKALSGKEYEQEAKLLEAKIRSALSPDAPAEADAEKVKRMTESVWFRYKKMTDLRREQAIAARNLSLADAELRRRVVKPAVNPDVAGDLANKDVISAAKGFKHKLGRVIATGSLKSYELPTKSETGNSKLTKKLIVSLKKDRHRAKKGDRRILTLNQKVETTNQALTTAESSLDRMKQLTEMVKENFQALRRDLNNAQKAVVDFREAEKAREVQDRLNNVSAADQFLGLMEIGFRQTFYGDVNSAAAKSIFDSQSEMENRMVNLGKYLKEQIKASGVMLENENIDENLNAQTSYDEQSVNGAILETRQLHLIQRLDTLDKLLRVKVNESAEKLKTTEDYKTKLQVRIREIEKFKNNLADRTPAELEKIFWHEFGDNILMIRKWQNNLPQVARHGRNAYLAQTTAISSQYEILKQQVLQFETENKIWGLSSLLARELGVIEKISQADPAINMARARLSTIQAQIKVVKEKRALISPARSSEIGDEALMIPSKLPESVSGGSYELSRVDLVEYMKTVKEIKIPLPHFGFSGLNQGFTPEGLAGGLRAEVSSVTPTPEEKVTTPPTDTPTPSETVAETSSATSTELEEITTPTPDDNVSETAPDTSTELEEVTTPPAATPTPDDYVAETTPDTSTELEEVTTPPAATPTPDDNVAETSSATSTELKEVTTPPTDTPTPSETIAETSSATSTEQEEKPVESNRYYFDAEGVVKTEITPLEVTEPTEYSNKINIQTPEVAYPDLEMPVDFGPESEKTDKVERTETPAAEIAAEQSQVAESVDTAIQVETVEAVEARELIRKTETMVIGDLNGSLDALEKNLISLKAIDQDIKSYWHWIAGNRTLVLMGDIIGERVPHGLEILQRLRDLKKSAEMNLGKIITLFGNHEDMAVSFLTERTVSGESEQQMPLHSWFNAILKGTWQGLGVLEFVARYTKYGRDDMRGDLEEIRTDVDNNFNSKRDFFLTLGKEARENMLADPEGKKLLESICEMKLVHRDGSTLFLHTELTKEILLELTSGNNLDQTIESINKDFSEGLKALLLEQKEMNGYSRYTSLCNTFLNPGNRNFLQNYNGQITAPMLDELAALGINRVVHGHSNHTGGQVYMFKNKIQIANVDFGTGLPGVDENLRSVAYLDRQDGLHLGRESAEELEEFNPVMEKLCRVMQQVFQTDKLDFYDIARQISENFMIFSEADIEKVFSERLIMFLWELKAGINSGNKKILLAPKSDQIMEMINFYYEFLFYLFDEKITLEQFFQEISDYGVDLMGIRKEWLKRHPEGGYELPLGQEKQALAEAAGQITEIAPEESSKLEVLTREQAEKMDFAELERRAMDNIGRLTGASYAQKSLLLGLLERLNLQSNTRYRNYIKLINQFPDAIEFLFTFKFQGAELLPAGKKLKKLSPAPSHLDKADLITVLGQPAALQSISEMLRKGDLDALKSVLASAKSVLALIKLLGKV